MSTLIFEYEEVEELHPVARTSPALSVRREKCRAIKHEKPHRFMIEISYLFVTKEYRRDVIEPHPSY